MVRIRNFPSQNYRAIFAGGNTVRLRHKHDREIAELNWPEFYDVALNTRCKTGQSMIRDKHGKKSNCHYCYASASLNGEYFPNVVSRVFEFFGGMSNNQRPFQVAIGGSGEPLEHSEIWDVCKAFNKLGIVPNYTTNGVLVREETVRHTLDLCGGVAVTCHPHMEVFWTRAIERLGRANIRLNTHHIISTRESIDNFKAIYTKWKDKIEYFVLLPYMNVGLAANNPQEIDYAYLEFVLDQIHMDGKIAFGANFHKWLLTVPKYAVSMYPPERFSKYVMLDKEGIPSIYNNSFDMLPIQFTWEQGMKIAHND